MKKLFTLLAILLPYLPNAQGWYFYDQCNLDASGGCSHQFIIDTANYPNNKWQTGKPQKTIFDSAFSYPNAIATDTLNPYPTNDTSVFIVKHTNSIWPFVSVFSLRFMYKLDIDSGEIAKIEVSGDSGLHWVNAMTEDTIYDFFWAEPKPRLDTSSHEWKAFDVVMSAWRNAAYFQKTYPSYISADTFLYRFTFISDGVQTNKEGWMMDNFLFQDWVEGVKDLQNNHLVDVYPNPSSGDITIKNNSTRDHKSVVSIYNLQGQKAYRTENIPSNGQLHLDLPDGLYYLKYSADEQYAIKKITIIN
ncbi:T9SS type A sorting domain-containing protein [Polluticoccus soli]|uniref:T9SS type A sorting domain-containing protein n=1 Tax=Polluticoccus soli TaxID=3034150 RepID=UPI0023E2C60F|nr:T9SS type A sorting domain-containing protein [Flavipsychrobacter sp. JY13-12]